ncbi:hypothetical protein AB3N02_22330 [Priestia aryabhattai]|uniref:hypothetical protein n=1 Tax=Priestia aryabhattai TaxID=412384 RepID=UPI0039A0B02D
MGTRDTKFPIPKNELFYYDEDAKASKPLVKGSSVPVTGVQNKILEAFEDIDYNNWDITTGTGDIIAVGGNTAGSGYVKISKGLDNDNTETVFTSKFIVKPAFRFGFGMSLSQRLMHQRFSIELVGVDADGNEVATMPVNTPVAVTNLSQATNTLTVTTATPHGLVPADRISLYGSADSRFNYGESLVATVINATQFTVTNTIFSAIPSVTASSTGSSFVSKVEPFSYADNAMGVIWEGTTTTNAKLSTRSNKSVLFNSNDTNMGTTNAVVANTNGFADAFNPTSIYDIRVKTENIIVRTMPVDSHTGYSGSIKRSQVIPDITTGYKIRIRARNNTGMSKPVGTILNAVKSGSTVGTITTAQPHGLTTSDWVMLHGMRDATNFANQSTQLQVASIVDANTFTVSFGASATASSRGGIVVRANGSYGIGASGQAIQSMSASGGLITITGNTSWTGFGISDTIELRGLVDSGSATTYTQYEGVYQVANLSGSTITLYAPNVADFTSINMGGAVVKRTDYRLHLLRVLDYTRQTVEIDSGMGNISDSQEAIPVNAVNFSTSQQGYAAHDAIVSGNPMRIAGRAVTTNYAGVATGDVADLITTVVGALINKPYSIPEGDWQYAGTAVTATTDVALKTAGGTGIRNYVTNITVQNTHATVATEFVIKDGSTVIYRGYLPANMALPAVINFPTPLKGTAVTAMNFACITTGANVYVNAQGYQAP